MEHPSALGMQKQHWHSHAAISTTYHDAVARQPDFVHGRFHGGRLLRLLRLLRPVERQRVPAHPVNLCWLAATTLRSCTRGIHHVLLRVQQPLRWRAQQTDNLARLI